MFSTGETYRNSIIIYVCTECIDLEVTCYNLLTVENICSGPSSVSGLKSDFFCSVDSRYLIQPAIADNELKT